MNQEPKNAVHSMPAEAFANFTRAVDEIRLRRSLDRLLVLMNSLDPSQRPKYLVDEVASQQRQLQELRDARNR